MTNVSGRSCLCFFIGNEDSAALDCTLKAEDPEQISFSTSLMLRNWFFSFMMFDCLNLQFFSSFLFLINVKSVKNM